MISDITSSMISDITTSDITSPDEEFTPFCRICFENEEFDNPLISPCLCNGTSKFVHKFCIRKWRKLNYNKRAFFKCMECNFNYVIEYSIPLENYFYSETLLQIFNLKLNYIVFNMLFFSLSLFLQTFELSMKKQIIYLFDSNPNRFFLEMLNSNTIYTTIYYYSIIVFFFSIWFHNFFVISPFFFIKRKRKYWKKIFLKCMIHYILSYQFIFFYYLCKSDHKLSPSNFLNFELILSICFMPFYGNLLLYHNKKINLINSKNIGTVRDRPFDV